MLLADNIHVNVVVLVDFDNVIVTCVFVLVEVDVVGVVLVNVVIVVVRFTITYCTRW